MDTEGNNTYVPNHIINAVFDDHDPRGFIYTTDHDDPFNFFVRDVPRCKAETVATTINFLAHQIILEKEVKNNQTVLSHNDCLFITKLHTGESLDELIDEFVLPRCNCYMELQPMVVCASNATAGEWASFTILKQLMMGEKLERMIAASVIKKTLMKSAFRERVCSKLWAPEGVLGKRARAEYNKEFN